MARRQKRSPGMHRGNFFGGVSDLTSPGFTGKSTNSLMLFSKDRFTPPKTNMEPENGPLEKEIPIGNHHFQVPC